MGNPSRGGWWVIVKTGTLLIKQANLNQRACLCLPRSRKHQFQGEQFTAPAYREVHRTRGPLGTVVYPAIPPKISSDVLELLGPSGHPEDVVPEGLGRPAGSSTFFLLCQGLCPSRLWSGTQIGEKDVSDDWYHMAPSWAGAGPPCLWMQTLKKCHGVVQLRIYILVFEINILQ